MSTSSHAPATPLPAKRPGANGHPCNEACGWAHGPLSSCTCICGGAKHGSFLARPGWKPTPKADPFAGLPVVDDEEW